MSEELSNAVTDELSHYLHIMAENFRCAVAEYERPSSIFRPKLFIDGELWCALYGENLQDGICGYGKSPKEAMYNFDLAWEKQINTADKNIKELA